MYKIERYKSSRYWAIYTPDDTLIAVVVYKRGALEIVRLLEESR